MGDQEKRAAVANQVKMLPPLEMTRDENIRKNRRGGHMSLWASKNVLKDREHMRGYYINTVVQDFLEIREKKICHRAVQEGGFIFKSGSEASVWSPMLVTVMFSGFLPPPKNWSITSVRCPSSRSSVFQSLFWWHEDLSSFISEASLVLVNYQPLTISGPFAFQ